MTLFLHSCNRTYEDLVPCLVEESDNKFVDADWIAAREVKTVEPRKNTPKDGGLRHYIGYA